MSNLPALVTLLSGMTQNDQQLISRELQTLIDNGVHSVDMPSDLNPTEAQEVFRLAFQGIGGLPRLMMYADRNPGQFYKLYARLLTAPTHQDPNTPEVETLPDWYQSSPALPQSSSSSPPPPEDDEETDA